MNDNKRKFINQIILLVDMSITVFSFIASYYIRSIFFKNYDLLNDIGQYTWILFVIVPVSYICFNYIGFYKNKKNRPIGIIFTDLFKAVGFSGLICFAFIYAAKVENFSRLYMGIFIGINFTLLFLEKLSLKYMLIFAHRNNRIDRSRVIIVGAPKQARRFALELKNSDHAVNFLGYVSIDKQTNFKAKKEKHLGSIEHLVDIIIKNSVDEVVFTLPKSYVVDVEEYILQCEELGVTTRLLLDIYNVKLSKTALSYVGSSPVLTFHTVSLNFVQLFFKRLMDIAGAVVGLAVTLVVSVFLIPIIKLDSPGRLFFCQKRVGLNGRIFDCYKFRSMYADAEQQKKALLEKNELSGAVFKLKDDPRVTRVGKIIRKLSIDELPQFWNVLMGDMSLVGTRPPTLDEVDEYKSRHRRRLSIKPGITGMWQVSGRNTITDFEKIVQLDFEYIDNWTIFLDIKIILKTIVVVIMRKGAQ